MPRSPGFRRPRSFGYGRRSPDRTSGSDTCCFPKDYVRYRLTGELATDASDASGTLLLDLRTRKWSNEILDRLEIPIEWLPTVHEGPDQAGQLRADVAGLTKGLVVAAGAGDNAAAAVGNGVVEAGIVSSSIGTSGVVFAHSDTPRIDSQGRVQSFCHAVPGKYHVMGVTLAAGGAFRWWRDAARPDLDYEAMGTLAAQAPQGSEGLVFLPYLSGERTPHRDPMARGAFVGLQLHHSAAHLTRAVMEGVVHSSRTASTWSQAWA